MKRLALLVVGAVTAVAAACSEADSNRPETVTPGPSVSATPPTAAGAANVAFAAAAPVLQRTFYQPGATLPPDNSVGFIDPVSGALELWTPVSRVSIPWLQPSRDGALIVAQVSADEWYVTERSTGKNWRLAPGLRPHIGIGYDAVLGAFTNINNGKLVLLDFAAGTATEIDYTRPNLMTYSVASTSDGRTIVVGDGETFVFVDLPTAAVTPLPGSYEGLRAEALDYDAGFALGESFVFDWSGNRLPGAAADYTGLSPDRQLRVRTHSLGRVALAEGLGELPLLDYFVLERVSDGAPLGRMLGAAFAGWSSDSHRMLVRDRERFRVISVTGETVAELGTSDAVTHAQFSPVDPGLISTGPTLQHIDTGTRWEYPVQPGASFGAAWRHAGPELIGTGGPIPGKGGGSGRQLFGPTWQTAPFSESVHLAVTTRACAPIFGNQQNPDTRLGCLAPATRLAIEVVTPPALGISPPHFAGSKDDPDRTWLHVATPDGLTGWVDAAYLDWAP